MATKKSSSMDFLGFSPKAKKGKSEPEVISREDMMEANNMARQLHVYKPGITFVPGADLEVLDVRDNNWYHCKVVEVDWGELDILVHYQRWSSRFNEWLKMDCTRIRPYVQKSRKMKKKPFFKLGEKVLARWAPDCRNYEAKITRIIDEESCEVLYYDGVSKIIKYSNIIKLHPSKTDFPIPGSSGIKDFSQLATDHDGDATDLQSNINKSSIFDVKILEQKRKPKRKAEVEELFESMKKKRKYVDDYSVKHTNKSPTVKSTTPVKPKVADYSVDSHSRSSTSSPSLTSNKIVEIPLNNGWQKCISKRPKYNKYDIFYVAPSGKKIRSKTELFKYIDNTGEKLDIETFDFSIGPVRDIINERFGGSISLSPASFTQDSEDEVNKFEDKCDADEDRPPSHKLDDSSDKIKEEVSELISEPSSSKDVCIPPRKVEIPIIAPPDSPVNSKPKVAPPIRAHSVKVPIKLPSIKIPVLISPSKLTHSLRKEPVLSDKDPSFKLEHNDHVCPKKDCGKSFRKGNLLQMHIKHYHPQLFKKAKVCAPNVADLAYARTVGDHLDNHLPSQGSSMFAASPEKEPKIDSSSRRGVRTSLVFNESKKVNPPKEIKKKEIKKDQEEEPKEELEEFINDLEEEEEPPPLPISEQDPDYVPEVEGDGGMFSRRKREGRRRRERYDSRSRKRKSESLSDDDFHLKTVPKNRMSKRKAPTTPKQVSGRAPITSFPDTPKTHHQPIEKSPVKTTSDAVATEEDMDTLGEVMEAASVVNTVKEIINCGCGSNEEEGLMLLCDVCLCWQHGACYNIDSEEQVPDKYICSICEHPRLLRSSHKFRHHQDWLKEGKLPRFSFQTEMNDGRLESCVRRSHELLANVWQMGNVIHSLRLKLHMAKLADHPKFVLWHKRWVEGKNQLASPDEHINLLNDMPVSVEVVSAIQQLLNIGNIPASQDNLSMPPDILTSYPSEITDSVGSDCTANISRSLSSEMPNMFPAEIPNILPSDISAALTSENLPSIPATSSVASSMSEFLPNTSINIPDLSSSVSPPIVNVTTTQNQPNSEMETAINDENDQKTQEINLIQKELQSTELQQSSSNIESLDSANTCELGDTIKDLCNSSAEIDLKEENSDSKTDPDSITTLETCKNSIPLTISDPVKMDCLDDKSTNVCKSKDELLIKTDLPKIKDTDESGESTPLNTKSEPEIVLPVESDSIKSDVPKTIEEQSSLTEAKENSSHPSETTLPLKQDSKSVEIDLKEESHKSCKDVKCSEDLPLNFPTADELKPSLSDSKIDDHLSLLDSVNKDSLPTLPSDLGTSFLSDVGSIVSEMKGDLFQNPESDAIEDGDLAVLDLGLSAAEEPSGTEFAALLSSQTDLDQFMSQDNNGLEFSINPPPVQAPIIPQAERIEPLNCKLNLLENVKIIQNQINARFDEMEKKLEVLEIEMGLGGEPFDDNEDDDNYRDPSTLQARDLVKLISNDIQTITKISQITPPVPRT